MALTFFLTTLYFIDGVSFALIYLIFLLLSFVLKICNFTPKHEQRGIGVHALVTLKVDYKNLTTQQLNSILPLQQFHFCCCFDSENFITKMLLRGIKEHIKWRKSIARHWWLESSKSTPICTTISAITKMTSNFWVEDVESYFVFVIFEMFNNKSKQRAAAAMAFGWKFWKMQIKWMHPNAVCFYWALYCQYSIKSNFDDFIKDVKCINFCYNPMPVFSCGEVHKRIGLSQLEKWNIEICRLQRHILHLVWFKSRHFLNV